MRRLRWLSRPRNTQATRERISSLAPLFFGIRGSILVRVPTDFWIEHHVDVGIGNEIVFRPRTDFETDGHGATPVDEMMTVRHVLRERCAIAGAQWLLAPVGDQDQLAGNHKDKFIFCRVPMALAGSRAWRQAQEIDPELSQAGRVAKPLPNSKGRFSIERRWIRR